MTEAGIGPLGMLKLRLSKVDKAREFLGGLSSKDLFNTHGHLNKLSIASFYKRDREPYNEIYPVGSFVVVDIPRNNRVMQIHFMPFNIPEKSIDRIAIIEAMCLGLADARKMFDLVEELYNRHGISGIFGQSKKEMALIAKEFGLDVRNNKINTYNNILTTQDIPDFLNKAREKLHQMKSRDEVKFQEHEVSERQARINAILRFIGKVR